MLALDRREAGKSHRLHQRHRQRLFAVLACHYESIMVAQRSFDVFGAHPNEPPHAHSHLPGAQQIAQAAVAAIVQPVIVQHAAAYLERIVVHMGMARSEEHTSELQSLMRISYAVFCLKKKIHTKTT